MLSRFVLETARAKGRSGNVTDGAGIDSPDLQRFKPQSLLFTLSGLMLLVNGLGWKLDRIMMSKGGAFGKGSDWMKLPGWIPRVI